MVNAGGRGLPDSVGAVSKSVDIGGGRLGEMGPVGSAGGGMLLSALALLPPSARLC